MLRYLTTLAAALLAVPAAAQVTLPAIVSVDEGKVAPVVAQRPDGVPKGKTLSFTYRTVAGTATAGQDFVARSGSQSIRKNANSYTINVQTVDDTTFEQDEKLYLEVTAAGVITMVPIVVRDNDPAPTVRWCKGGVTVPWPQPCPVDVEEPAPDPVIVEPGDPVLVPDEPITTVPTQDPPATNPPPVPPVDDSPAAPDPMGGYVLNPDPDGPNGGGLPPVHDGLKVSDWLRAVPIPKSAEPDWVGAFRFTCTAGPIKKIDPIVTPRERGKTHWHQGFGNTEWNEASAYESLRKFGDSTCLNPLNRSAYWMPAMWCGKTQFCRPDHFQIYYKRLPKSSIYCNPTDPKRQIGKGGECREFPRGIRFVFGYDMITAKLPTGAAYWMCSSGSLVKAPDSSHKPDIPSAMATCPEGARLSVSIKGPGCYDKRYLDTPNHRDHVAYHVRDPNTGVNRCPDSHPDIIAGFTLTAVWHVTPALKQAANDNTLCLDSDYMVPGAVCGTTVHADWDPAWNDEIKSRFHRCFDELKNASSGDICDGWQIRNLHQTKFPSLPQVVPAPTDPDAFIAIDIPAAA